MMDTMVSSALCYSDQREFEAQWGLQKYSCRRPLSSTRVGDDGAVPDGLSSDDDDGPVDFNASIRQAQDTSTLEEKLKFIKRFLNIKMSMLQEKSSNLRQQAILGEKWSSGKRKEQTRVNAARDELDPDYDAQEHEDEKVFAARSIPDHLKGKDTSGKAVTWKTGPKMMECILKCNQKEHPYGSLFRCDHLRKLGTRERILTIKKIFFCPKCLQRAGKNHKCYIDIKCRLCGSNAHNQLLCTTNMSEDERTMLASDMEAEDHQRILQAMENEELEESVMKGTQELSMDDVLSKVDSKYFLEETIFKATVEDDDDFSTFSNMTSDQVVNAMAALTVKRREVLDELPEPEIIFTEKLPEGLALEVIRDELTKNAYRAVNPDGPHNRTVFWKQLYGCINP